MNIKTMNVQELKALAYDFLAQKEQAEANLRTVNQEIALKIKEQKEFPLAEEKKVEKQVDTITKKVEKTKKK